MGGGRTGEALRPVIELEGWLSVALVATESRPPKKGLCRGSDARRMRWPRPASALQVTQRDGIGCEPHGRPALLADGLSTRWENAGACTRPSEGGFGVGQFELSRYILSPCASPSVVLLLSALRSRSRCPFPRRRRRGFSKERLDRLHRHFEGLTREGERPGRRHDDGAQWAHCGLAGVSDAGRREQAAHGERTPSAGSIR